MEVLETLYLEHDLIRRCLKTLSLAIDGLEHGRRPPVACFERAIEFAGLYTDKFHHFKEEFVLFGRLAEKHEGALDAQLEVLKRQHERGRDLVKKMKACLPGYKRADDFKTENLILYAASYVSLLRQHIHREDQVFFPMVKKELTLDEHQAVLAEFRAAAARDAETPARALALVSEMDRLLEA